MGNPREEAIDKAWDGASQASLDNKWYVQGNGTLLEIREFEDLLRDAGYVVVPVVITGSAGLNPHDLRVYQLGYMAARERQLNPNPNLVGEKGSGWSE